MTSFGKTGSQGNQLLPTERVFFNYGNENNISGYNSFFGGKSAGGGAVSENKLVLNNDTSKLLFAGNFDAGLDTLFDFNCYFRGTLLAEGRNTEATVGSSQLTYANSSASMNILMNAPDMVGADYILESKNYLKLNNIGRAFVKVQGIFEHQGVTTNTTAFSFAFDGDESIQADWNVDTFGAAGKNPSGLTLDFTKLQTLVFGFNNKGQGDVLCGFLVNNIIYLAHRFQINNLRDNTTAQERTQTFNLPFRDEMTKTGAVTVKRTVGFFNAGDGVAFTSAMDITNDPNIIINEYINSVVCYGIGADTFSKRLPVSVGNKANFVSVSAADTPLFSVRAKAIYSNDPNRTVFNIDKLMAHATGANLNNACYIRVVYNANLTGDSFIDIPDSDSGLEYDLSATSFSGGIELFFMPVYEDQVYAFSHEDLHHIYQNYFSRVAIDGIGITQQVLSQTLTVSATPMVEAMEVSANFICGEIA